MTNALYSAIIAVQVTVWTCFPALAMGRRPSMKFESTDHVEPTILQSYCNNTFYKVIILKDSKGRIGGYVLQPAIMDSPIPYLDCHGNTLTAFHIFDSDEDKAKAMRIITPLTEQFPVQAPLDCGKSK